MIRKIFSRKNLPLVAGVTASAALIGGLLLYHMKRKLSKPIGGVDYPKGIVDADHAKQIKLTQEEAETRFKCICGVRYNVSLSMAKGLDKYAGSTTISFRVREEVKEMPEELFVDFRGKVLTKCELNGTKIKKFEKQRIYFKTAEQKRGDERNTLKVELDNNFVHKKQTGRSDRYFKKVNPYHSFSKILFFQYFLINSYQKAQEVALYNKNKNERSYSV